MSNLTENEIVNLVINHRSNLSSIKNTLDSIKNDIDKKSRYLDKLIFKLCDHKWEIDRSAMSEHTEYYCSKCYSFK